MAQDGQDPPKVGSLVSQPKRPKLSVIVGGGAKKDEPEPHAIVRSAMSEDGRARLWRAQRLLGAERAFLFVWNDVEFTLTEAAACDETGGEPRDHSVMWSLLDRITSQRAPLVMAGTDEQPTDAMMSGITPPLRMAIGVPIIAGDDLKGVACFDKRIHKGQFVDSDVRAASAILHDMGFHADGLKPLISGTDTLGRPPTAPEIAATLSNVMGPNSPAAGGLHVTENVSSPRLTEVSFWVRQLFSNGVVRLVCCRLTSPQTGSDLLVARTLACYRALSLLSDAGSHEQLLGLPFEVERLSPEPYALHAIGIDYAPDGSCAIRNVGSGAIFHKNAAGVITSLVSTTEPFARGMRASATGSTELKPGEFLLCAHGAENVSPEALFAQSCTPSTSARAGVSTWLIKLDT